MTRAIFDPAIFDPAIFDSHPTVAIFDPAIFDPRIFDTGTVVSTGGPARGAFTLTYPTEDEDAVAVIAAIAAALAGPI